MALMYMAATAMPYSGSYLMHARTKGSKNGISNTPGYVAVGDKAKGRLVNGVYVYDTPQTTNTPKTLAKRAQEKAGGYSNYMARQAALAKNAGNNKLYNTYASNARSSAYNRNKSNGKITTVKPNNSNVLSADKGVKVERPVQKNNPTVTTVRTPKTILDRIIDVGSEVWGKIKDEAIPAIKKGGEYVTEFLTGRKARADLESHNYGEYVNQYPQLRELYEQDLAAYRKTLPGMAETAWNSVKAAGQKAIDLGKPLVEKAVGAVKENAPKVASAVAGLAKDAGEAMSTIASGAKEKGVTMIRQQVDSAQRKMDSAKNSNDYVAAQQELNFWINLLNMVK